MSTKHINGTVSVWEEKLVIPTYPPGAPDPNPMFFEKRVDQGASGRIYPNPITDLLSGHKEDRAYRAIYLENDYLQLIILPELGGRIFAGLDKTNGYEFLYRQHVIKPALIGLFGPWISGGMEFNWPQHHRPSTFMPVDYCLEEHADGSRIVWLGEHEPLNRTKGMVGVCLHPKQAVVELKVRLYNRTPFAQTFLWWANAAVSVNERYQIFFPPDVTYVTFHSKQAMAHYPIAREIYMGIDYTEGVDISWYKNSTACTSYFAGVSRHDFFGGYDRGRKAGLVHLANHHLSPGKKLFTWGVSDFSRAWERNLTDADGPYAELMAGVFSDNQPDFSWLQPHESKSFSQYWYPIQRIGPPQNANRQAAVSLGLEAGGVKAGVYATQVFRKAAVRLTAKGLVMLDWKADLGPGRPFTTEAALPEGAAATDLLLTVHAADGSEIIRYAPEQTEEKPLPEIATQPPAPQEIATTEGLYLTGLHVEQYRHPTLAPELYWREALRRDPKDARNNLALGRLLLRRGEFAAAAGLFQRAIETLTRWNPNPYDGEPYYYLGLALRYQNRHDEAYAAFYKAVWSHAWQAAGYYALAAMDCRRGDFAAALDHLARSLQGNALNLKARNLLTAVWRKMGLLAPAEEYARATIALDPLDFWARYELYLASKGLGKTEDAGRLLQDFSVLLRGETQNYLDLAFDYGEAGFWQEAGDLLAILSEEKSGGRVHPMLLYALGYFASLAGREEKARDFFRQAAAAPPDYCFPARLEEMEILEAALAANPGDARAHYYLGNLLYDKKRYEDALEHWETSCRLAPDFFIPRRNLGIAYYNVRRDPEKALACYARACDIKPDDARIFFELDQLRKRMGVTPAERLASVEQRHDLVRLRDDLSGELITLYNLTGQPQKALDLLLSRRLRPWEGGENLIAAQYVAAKLSLGRAALEAGRPEQALAHYEAARIYPESLGVGKWNMANEADLHYYAGLARDAMGDGPGAEDCFRRAAEEIKNLPFLNQMHLKYYQALALRKLGDEVACRKLLHGLREHALQEMEAERKRTFETSMPNFSLFLDDQAQSKRAYHQFLIGLAHLGLGEIQAAEKAFLEVLALDAGHFGAVWHLHDCSGEAAKQGNQLGACLSNEDRD